MGWQKARREQGLDVAQKLMMAGPGILTKVDGVPLAEYTQGSLQPCIRCGRDPRETDGGILVDIRVVEQVVVADTLCEGCMDDGEREGYQAVQDAK